MAGDGKEKYVTGPVDENEMRRKMVLRGKCMIMVQYEENPGGKKNGGDHLVDHPTW